MSMSSVGKIPRSTKSTSENKSTFWLWSIGSTTTKNANKTFCPETQESSLRPTATNSGSIQTTRERTTLTQPASSKLQSQSIPRKKFIQEDLKFTISLIGISNTFLSQTITADWPLSLSGDTNLKSAASTHWPARLLSSISEMVTTSLLPYPTMMSIWPTFTRKITGVSTSSGLDFCLAK